MNKFLSILCTRRVLALIETVLSFLLLLLLAINQLLPLRYLIGFTMIFLILIFVFYNTQIPLSKVKGKHKKAQVNLIIASKILQILMCIILLIGNYYVIITGIFINDIGGGTSENTIAYSVIAMKNSPLSVVKDLEDQSIGYFEPSSQEDAQRFNQIVSKVNNELENPLTPQTYATKDEAVNALYNTTIDTIVIQEADRASYSDIKESFDDETKVIERYEIKIPSAKANRAAVTKEPFLVFISGADAYGEEISSTSRSDVNMVAAINPTTKQVLLISIPRDYYVEVPGTNGSEKLTHTGIRGISTTIDTVELLMGVDFNYYAKLNYTSFMNVIDAIGGITINNPYGEFTTRIGFYVIKEGKNKLNSKQALAFVRERHSFANGDIARIQNQQMMIKAILKKLTSASSIINLNGVFSAVKGCVETNMSSSEIKSLINMEMDDMATWDVQSYHLEGINARRKDFALTGSSNKNGLAVVLPNEESVTQGKEYIRQVMNNEIVKIESETRTEKADPNANDKYMTQKDTKKEVQQATDDDE